MRNYKDLDINYQGGDLELDKRELTSLIGCPEHITGDFYCGSNYYMGSLVGGPQKVDGDYNCYGAGLTDLVGCASHIGAVLSCGGNAITSLVGIHKIIKSCATITFNNSDVSIGGIGLLLIDDLTWISSATRPFEIIKSYLGTGTKGMMECSKELKARGYEDYAKL